jgi:hypothetical protein
VASLGSTIRSCWGFSGAVARISIGLWAVAGAVSATRSSPDPIIIAIAERLMW